MFCGKTVCIIWHCIMIATVDGKLLIEWSLKKKKEEEHRTKYTAPEPGSSISTNAKNTCTYLDTKKRSCYTVLHWGKTVNCEDKL